MTVYKLYEQGNPDEQINRHLAYRGLEQAKVELFKYLTERAGFKPENIRQVPTGGYHSYAVECNYEGEPDFLFYYHIDQITVI